MYTDATLPPRETLYDWSHHGSTLFQAVVRDRSEGSTINSVEALTVRSVAMRLCITKLVVN